MSRFKAENEGQYESARALPNDTRDKIKRFKDKSLDQAVNTPISKQNPRVLNDLSFFVHGKFTQMVIKNLTFVIPNGIM